MLKLRAWDKTKNRLSEVMEINFERPSIRNGWQVVLDYKVFDKPHATTGIQYARNIVCLNDVVLMRSIGLKEKDNIELFTDYIISHNDNKFILIDSIAWGTVAVAINKNLGTVLQDKIITVKHNWRDYNWIYNVQKYIKYAGNIYENPELLTK